MIPKNIKRDHVLKALEKIASDGIPPQRSSRDYWLVYKGHSYPPKYVISIANIFANYHELDSKEFISTEARRFLEKLNFTITRSRVKPPTSKPIKEFDESIKKDSLQQERAVMVQKIIRQYNTISLKNMAELLWFENPIKLQRWLMEVFLESPLRIEDEKVIIRSGGTTAQVEEEIDALLKKYREWEGKQVGK